METGAEPNQLLRVLDIINTAVACTALAVVAHSDLAVMLVAAGVPGFYLVEKVHLWRNPNAETQLCGIAGWHMLLHLSAIVASVMAAFRIGPKTDVPLEADLEAGFFGLIVGPFCAALFLPRRGPQFETAVTNAELRTIILGISRSSAAASAASAAALSHREGDNTKRE
jgi:hypothetical protein